MNRNLGLSVKHPLENVFSSGYFDCIELCIGADFNVEGAFDVFYDMCEKTKALCKKYNVKINSYHLPYNGERYEGRYMHAPSAFDKALRDKTLEYTKREISALLDTDIKFVVIHGSLRTTPEERPARVDNFVEYLRELCDFCAPHGITVAVETLLESCIGGGGDDPQNRIPEMKYIMENVKRDNIGICLDNNHFIKSSSIDFVKELGQYVVTTHFSDYYGTDECHNIPGNGTTDWKKLTSLLIEKGYKGPWLFEIRFKDLEYPTDEELSQLYNSWKNIIG